MKLLTSILVLSLTSAPVLADTIKTKGNSNTSRIVNGNIDRSTHNESRDFHEGDTVTRTTTRNSNNSTTTTTNHTTNHNGLSELSITHNGNHASLPSPVLATAESIPTITFYFQNDTVGNVFGTQLTIPLN